MGTSGRDIDCVVLDLDGTLTAPGAVRTVPGVEEMLAALAGAGVELAVATSAPTPVARRVLLELGLDRWFASVAGSPPNGGVAGKDAIVAEALLGLGRPLPDGGRGAAVVGDGAGDMAAATRHGLLAVGAAWAGAPARRLREAGAAVVVEQPAQLVTLVVGEGHPRAARGLRTRDRP